MEAKFLAKEAAWKRRSPLLETRHRLMLGDAREMPHLAADEQVDLVVTSPPYWNLKRYGDDLTGAQLGHIADREAFLAEVRKVWRRCFDLLTPGGRLCIVVGDVCRSRKAHGRHLVEPLHAHLQIECEAIGFDPLAPIVWHKIANAATEMGGGSAFLGKPYEPNAVVKNDIEYILVFRKPGGYRRPTQEQRDLSLLSKEDHQRWFRQLWLDVPGEIQRGHPAPFPKEIARRLIGMFSFVGDVVLDPFVGTGTTSLAAMETHRNSIGYEIDPAYLSMAKSRLSEATFGATVEIVGG